MEYSTLPGPLRASLPSRGAWIEITKSRLISQTQAVAPLAGSVDRNLLLWIAKKASLPSVAPLAGSVDRNDKEKQRFLEVTPSLPSRGAWIEMGRCHACGVRNESLPSRGAWIEICSSRRPRWMDWVAPLAGSVDRNKTCFCMVGRGAGSLPSRGAWIEIGPAVPPGGDRESLPSRGAWIEIKWGSLSVLSMWSLPSRGAWIEITGAAT